MNTKIKKIRKKAKVITLAKLFLHYPIQNTIRLITVPITEEEYSLFLNEEDKTIKSSEYLSGTKDTLVVTESFFKNKKVKDKWRYNLEYKSSEEKWDLFTPCGQAIIKTPSEKDDSIRCCDQDISDSVSQDANNKNILIILESPHKEEYSKDGNFTPLSPANGTTGVEFYNNFHNCVLPILHSTGLIIPNNQKYKIFFVEPIPYQASLVKIHNKSLDRNDDAKSIRNKVWMALYSELEHDFKTRVQSYEPFIILNGCTSTLKSQVQETLGTIQNNQNIQMFKVPHPCNWARIFNQFANCKKVSR